MSTRRPHYYPATNHTGWGWPVGARKVHYFRDGYALCSSRPTVTFGEEYDIDPQTNAEDRALACVTCLARWEKRRTP